VELKIKKPKPNGATTKLSAVQKPCEKMAEAIVMDGGKRDSSLRSVPTHTRSEACIGCSVWGRFP